MKFAAANYCLLQHQQQSPHPPQQLLPQPLLRQQPPQQQAQQYVRVIVKVQAMLAGIVTVMSVLKEFRTDFVFMEVSVIQAFAAVLYQPRPHPQQHIQAQPCRLLQQLLQPTLQLLRLPQLHSQQHLSQQLHSQQCLPHQQASLI